MRWKRASPDHPSRDVLEPKDGVVSLSVPIGIGATLSVSEKATPRFTKAWDKEAAEAFRVAHTLDCPVNSPENSNSKPVQTDEHQLATAVLAVPL
jgi:hypothetical protein